MAQQKGRDVAKRGVSTPAILNEGSMKDMFLEEVQKGGLDEMMSKYVTLEELVVTAVQAAQRVPKLFQCTPSSLLLAFKRCAELGLNYSAEFGWAALVPFKNSETNLMEATHITGYKGLVELVERTKLYKPGNTVAITQRMITEGWFRLREHEDPPFHLDRTPALGLSKEELGPVVGYFSFCQHRQGGWVTEFMDMAEIKLVEAVSKAKKGPWKGPFKPQMEKKTVYKRMVGTKMSKTKALALAVSHDNETFGLDEEKVAKMIENKQSQAEQPGVNGLKDRMGIKDRDGKSTGAQAEVKVEKEEKEKAPGKNEKKGISYYLEQIRSYHVKKGLKDWWGHHESLVLGSFSPDEINTVTDAYNDRLALLDQKERENEDNKQGSLT